MLLLSAAGFSQAQAPVPLPPGDYSVPVGDRVGGPAYPPPPIPVSYDQRCSVDLIVGFPTGVRLQHELRGIGENWLLEAFAGVELIFPMAGGGIRRRCTVACGERDTFSISPGVDAYIVYNTLHNGDGWFSGGPVTAGLVTADADLLWQHSINDRLSSHLGLKLGAGPPSGSVK